MPKYVTYQEICEHSNDINNAKLKLIPGTIYKEGAIKNFQSEVLSKLMCVGTAGGMCLKNKENNLQKEINENTAYIVLTITHNNNHWNDSIDYDKNEIIYYGDNQKSSNIYDTKHKGNLRLDYLYKNIQDPNKQYPLFLFDCDEDCDGYDYKYIGIAVPNRDSDSITIVHDESDGKTIPNYKVKMSLTQDTVEFKWITDIINGIIPIESKYCPLKWKKAILGYQSIIEKSDDSKNNEIVVKDNYIIDYQPRTEGEKVHIDTTKYERDPKLGEQAIKYHGTKRAACNFDFEKNMER